MAATPRAPVESSTNPQVYFSRPLSPHILFLFTAYSFIFHFASHFLCYTHVDVKHHAAEFPPNTTARFPSLLVSASLSPLHRSLSLFRLIFVTSA